MSNNKAPWCKRVVIYLQIKAALNAPLVKKKKIKLNLLLICKEFAKKKPRRLFLKLNKYQK